MGEPVVEERGIRISDKPIKSNGNKALLKNLCLTKGTQVVKQGNMTYRS